MTNSRYDLPTRQDDDDNEDDKTELCEVESNTPTKLQVYAVIIEKVNGKP